MSDITSEPWCPVPPPEDEREPEDGVLTAEALQKTFDAIRAQAYVPLHDCRHDGCVAHFGTNRCAFCHRVCRDNITALEAKTLASLRAVAAGVTDE